MEELRFAQSGRKICNPNTAFTCNLIEFGKLLSGEWSSRCLLFRCAHHLPHDLNTSVMKLCVDPTTRALVQPDLTWFNRSGVYFIRPGAGRVQSGGQFDEGEQDSPTDLHSANVYIWVGDHASVNAVAETKRLVELMRGIFFDRRLRVDVVNKGHENGKFLSMIQGELALEEVESPRPTYTDYWDDAQAVTPRVSIVDVNNIAEERAVRGFGTRSNESYIYRKPQASARSCRSADEDIVSVVSDLAFSEDDDFVFGFETKFPQMNGALVHGGGFSLSLPPKVSRSVVMSALQTESASDEEAGQEDEVCVNEECSENHEYVDGSMSSIVPVKVSTYSPASISAETTRKPDNISSAEAACIALHGPSRRIPLPAGTGSSRISGTKRFNVPSLMITESPLSSGNSSICGSASGSNSSSPSTSRSSFNSGQAPDPRGSGLAFQVGNLSASDRVRSMLGPSTDLRRQLSPATTSTILSNRARSGSFVKNFFSGSPRSSASPKSERTDSTRIPMDIGLARGATPVQDLLPSSARIVKKSKYSSKGRSGSSGNSVASEQSMSIDSAGDRGDRSGDRVMTRSSSQSQTTEYIITPRNKLKMKPVLYVFEPSGEYPGKGFWTPLLVYDDDDLANVRFLPLC
jgi:hypothetical protein